MTSSEFHTLTKLVTDADVDGLTRIFETTDDPEVLKNVLKATDCTALKGIMLLIASRVGNESLGICLVESAAPSNTPDEMRNTALHIAAVGGMMKLVRAMCEAGGDVFAKNYRNFTPLQEATLHYRFDVSLYLSNVMLSKTLIMWPSVLPPQDEYVPNSESTEHSSVCDPYTTSTVVDGMKICSRVHGNLSPQSISYTSSESSNTPSVTCNSNTVDVKCCPVKSQTSPVPNTAVEKLVDSWLVRDPQPIPRKIH